jgi:NAD(P)-dependent dehydrogenase (short-subunit alcohol dehydrogenase family)
MPRNIRHRTLDGKAILVTGGGSGIGHAAALAMAQEGARLAIADLDRTSAAATADRIIADGGQAISLGGDVTKSADIAAMIKETVASFGRLDAAFNNAGVAPHQVGSVLQRTHEWTNASFDRMIETDLKSVWLCMKHEIPAMLAGGGGAIVNTASIAGLIGLHSAAAYVAAKHGVIGLTRTAALEYAADGIRVNAVCPGFIETRMTKFAVALRGDQIKARIPMGRLGVPEEIAALVVWLCSERAGFVTGAAYPVDGGMSAG